MSSDEEIFSKICVTENIRAGEDFKIHKSNRSTCNYLECKLFKIIFSVGYLLKTEADSVQVLTQNSPHLQYYAVSRTGTTEEKNLRMVVHIVTKQMSRVSIVKELYKSVGNTLQKCKMKVKAVSGQLCLDGITVVEHLVEAYKQSITSETVEEISPKDYNNGTNSFTNLFQDDGKNSGGKAGIKSIQMEEIRNIFHAGLALQVVENSKKRPIRRPSKRVLEARLDNMKVRHAKEITKQKEITERVIKEGKGIVDRANKEIARMKYLLHLKWYGEKYMEDKSEYVLMQHEEEEYMEEQRQLAAAECKSVYQYHEDNEKEYKRDCKRRKLEMKDFFN